MSASEQGIQLALPYSIAPRPDWVRDVIAAEVVENGTDSPFVYSLVDYQLRVLDGTVESFQRTQVKILDESVIEEMSQHLYDVVPGSQRMEFHRCEVLRGDKATDGLDVDNIRCMQREAGLERHVSTEDLTIELIIDDLRVGDTLILESSFIETSNEHPMYGKYFRKSFRLCWSCPVALQSIRVSNDSNKEIVLQHIDSAADLNSIISIAPADCYDQQWKNLTPQKPGYCLPADYWPPYVMVSSKSQWSEISSYLHSYYGNVGATNENLDLQGIEELELNDLSDESIIKCIRFVQDNIRYRSESGGVFSHTPKKPEKTLKRRTGDCKDKSNLMVAMLSVMGVKADLVLVNTSLKEGVDSVQPSPFLFDHMIVRFEWQGKTYFVDATSQKQGGGIEHLGVVKYKKALPIVAEGSGLVDIEFDNNKDVYTLRHKVDFRSAENDKPTIEIIREYAHHRANNMRYYFASSQMSLLEDSYLQGTAESFGVKLSAVKPLSIEKDDMLTNTLITRELYQIDTPVDEIKDGRLSVHTNFYEDLDIPSTDDNPVLVELDGIENHHISILYDNKPATDAETFECANEWFDYKDTISVEDKNLQFDVRLAPGKQQIVPLGELEGYRKQYESLQERSMSGFPVVVESNAAMLGYLAMPAVLIGVGVAVVSQKYFIAAGLGFWFVQMMFEHIKNK